MFGLWCAAFGQRAGDFWSSNPDEFYAIYDAYLDESNRVFLVGGTVASAIMNANSRKGAKAYTPTDVFPHLRGLEPKPSVDELWKKAKKIFGPYARKG